MNIKVYQNRDTHQIDNDVYGTQNENNVTELKIEVPEQYENWNKRIVFLTEEGNFWDYIKDDTYTIKNNITKYEELEAYIWLTENAESIEESVNDFRSRTFRLSFFANENADNLVPDEKQIDGFNSMLTVLNAEIKEVKQINTDFKKLKQEVDQAEDKRNKAEASRNTSEKAREKAENNRDLAETERKTAESVRKKNESERIVNENNRVEAENSRSNAEKTRQANESERIANESARKLAEENREKTTKEAVNNIKDLSANYEQLAEEKKTELNNYTTNLETSLKNKLDTYEEVKEEELDIHKTTLETEMTNTKDALVQEIKTAQNGFDENVTAKTTEFNNNATEKTNTFNSNAETKTTDFNTNASTKKTEYDNNATSKLEEYNSNATAKLEEYNNNSTTKLAEFNENAESYEKRIAELETERDEIAQQMPWNTTDIQESIHIEDSAKYSRNKLLPFGNLKQETRSGKNKFKIPESATSNGITYTKNADGTFNLKGTATESAVFKITVEIEKTGISWANPITLSSNVTTDINKFMALQATNGNTWVSSLCSLNTGGKKVTVTLTKPNTTHIRFLIQVNKGQTIDWKNAYIQLENNPDATDFEPYGAMPSLDYPSMPQVVTGVQTIKLNDNIIATLDLETTELCKIVDKNGNVVAQDMAVYREVDGVWKWQWEKNVYKDIIKTLADKSPKLITSRIAENLLGIVFISDVLHKNIGQIIAIVSNKLKSKFLGSTTDTTDINNVRNSEGIAIHSNNTSQICITLEKTRLETEDLDGLINFIVSNDISYYYPTLRPIYEDCTESQSATLDKLYKLQLEQGTNNIFVESENGVTTELQLTYMQDLNSKFNKLEAMILEANS